MSRKQLCAFLNDAIVSHLVLVPLCLLYNNAVLSIAFASCISFVDLLYIRLGLVSVLLQRLTHARFAVLFALFEPRLHVDVMSVVS